MTARAIVLASALLSLAAPAAARPKLTLPVDGAPTITAYYDRDRQAGAVADVHGPAPARWVPGRAYDQHAGTDYVLAGRSGYPALAAADGVVIAHEDGWDNAMGCGCLGNYVVIDHGEGVVTRYGHLEKHTLSAAVVEHRRVARGEVLGTVGNSGWSTATHLHFQVEVDGAIQNGFSCADAAVNLLARRKDGRSVLLVSDYSPAPGRVTVTVPGDADLEVTDLFTGKTVARLDRNSRNFALALRRDFNARLYHLQAATGPAE